MLLYSSSGPTRTHWLSSQPLLRRTLTPPRREPVPRRRRITRNRGCWRRPPRGDAPARQSAESDCRCQPSRHSCPHPHPRCRACRPGPLRRDATSVQPAFNQRVRGTEQKEEGSRSTWRRRLSSSPPPALHLTNKYSMLTHHPPGTLRKIQSTTAGAETLCATVYFS